MSEGQLERRTPRSKRQQELYTNNIPLVALLLAITALPQEKCSEKCWAGAPLEPCTCEDGLKALETGNRIDYQGETYFEYTCCEPDDPLHPEMQGEECGNYDPEALAAIGIIFVLLFITCVGACCCCCMKQRQKQAQAARVVASSSVATNVSVVNTKPAVMVSAVATGTTGNVSQAIPLKSTGALGGGGQVQGQVTPKQYAAHIKQMQQMQQQMAQLQQMQQTGGGGRGGGTSLEMTSMGGNRGSNFGAPPSYSAGTTTTAAPVFGATPIFDTPPAYQPPPAFGKY